MPKEYNEKTDEEKAAEERKRQRAGAHRDDNATQNLMGQVRELDGNLAALHSIAQRNAR